MIRVPYFNIDWAMKVLEQTKANPGAAAHRDDLGFTDIQCPTCGAYLFPSVQDDKGDEILLICLNACHLSPDMRARFRDSIQQAAANWERLVDQGQGSDRAGDI